MYYEHGFSCFYSIIHPYNPSSLLGPLDGTYCLHRTVITGWPKLVCPCVGVHGRKSLMSLSLLGRSSLFYLVCQTSGQPKLVCPGVGVNGRMSLISLSDKWLWSCCFVGCWFLDWFKTECIILVQLTSSFSPSNLLKSKCCSYIVLLT